MNLGINGENMSFVRIKAITDKLKDGRKKVRYYAYLCECVWNKDTKKNQQKVLKYLGKVAYLKPVMCDDVIKVGAKCVVCGSTANLSIDHILPLSKQGNNDLSNLQVLCCNCNKKKGNSTNA